MSPNLSEYRIIEDSFSSRSRKPRRLVFFLWFFLPLLLASQVYVFSQPAVYASEATVLTTAATDVDQTSPSADLQHVNIQKQVLLGQAVLEKTGEKLREQDSKAFYPIVVLRLMFSVNPVPATNLLKLQAEGGDPGMLQNAVKTWIEAYQQVRAEYVNANSENVVRTVRDELLRIEGQVDDKRGEIDQFRLRHGILSEESADNQAHARLQGLNESLNKALDEEVKAKAKMDALRNAVAQGKAVVPESDSKSLAVMIEQAGKLNEKLENLRGQYTEEYIQFNPALRKIVQELADLQQKINAKLKSDSSIAVMEAENQYAAAHQALRAIQEQMAEHKKLAADFTTQFAKHQAMQQELLSLESLQQETKQRLADLEVKQRQNYPQVEIIDTASLPSKALRPDYLFESAVAFAASLAAALFAVWLGDYLRKAETPQPVIAGISANYLYREPVPDIGEAIRPQPLGQNPLQSIENQTAPRELTREEATGMLAAADRQTREILILLLNGLTGVEIASLIAGDFDLAHGIVNIPASQRSLKLTDSGKSLLSESGWTPIQFPPEEFDAMLICAAIDAGLVLPEQIQVETIRYSYALFLVRQGIKLSELPKIIGQTNPAQLLQLGKFSPEGAGVSLNQINLDFLKTADA